MEAFRTVANESLDYGCVRPTSDADYEMKVQHVFDSSGNALSLRLDYTLEPTDTTPLPHDSTVDRVRIAIAGARASSAKAPVNLTGTATAANDELDQMSKNGLLDVLASACFPQSR